MIRVADVAGSARSVVRRTSRAAFSRRAAPAWAAGATIAAALATAIALGGLGRSEATPVQLTAGDEVRMPLYAVTVLDVELADELEEKSLSADRGETLVIVTVRLENLTDRPIGVGRAADKVEANLVGFNDPLLNLTGVTPADSAQAWRSDSSAATVFLQPGVPSEVTLAWTAPEDAFADGIVELDVYDAVESRGQILISADHINWRRGDLTARITVDTEAGG
ncbi:hypothetical protein [Microbacterium sp.]|uniref:hypothetical protein n=1 Tax=Microbacterium sp. TaxID=51671 RepID=UPI00273623EC|nr:hypothetical protein [Microbacterium sp.]MDP3952192.1 hypothetical protein [Microbacterium sp.]